MPTIEQAREWYPASDPVHGFDHVLRVYRLAERLAQAEAADLEIVRAAVLLHDAGPGKTGAAGFSGEAGDDENRNNHQHVSAEFARVILRAEGWSPERIEAVVHCVRSHRFRDSSEQPDSIEAKVVFDADKLDAIGAMGAARAISYAVLHNQPVYAPASRDFLNTGKTNPGEPHSSYHEHLFKLRRIKDRLLTPSGRMIAEERHRFLEEFYERLVAEIDGER
jgi:uncharacterized protein